MGNKKDTKTNSNTKQYKIEPSKTKKKTRHEKEETQKGNNKGKKKKKHSKLKKVIFINCALWISRSWRFCRNFL